MYDKSIDSEDARFARDANCSDLNGGSAALAADHHKPGRDLAKWSREAVV